MLQVASVVAGVLKHNVPRPSPSYIKLVKCQMSDNSNSRLITTLVCDNLKYFFGKMYTFYFLLEIENIFSNVQYIPS
jgi:hypothetical protein